MMKILEINAWNYLRNEAIRLMNGGDPDIHEDDRYEYEAVERVYYCLYHNLKVEKNHIDLVLNMIKHRKQEDDDLISDELINSDEHYIELGERAKHRQIVLKTLKKCKVK
jgi:hypothetical protein